MSTGSPLCSPDDLDLAGPGLLRGRSVIGALCGFDRCEDLRHRHENAMMQTKSATTGPACRHSVGTYANVLTAGRIGVYFALSGLARLVAWALEISKMGAICLAGTALVAVDVAIWLRNNPTRKQIERRRLKNADEAVRPDE